jgi:hypothetical protein
MPETQTTPGPWVWRGKSGSLHRVGEPPYQFGETVLAPTYEYESGVDTIVSDADAALIAAAPDMLGALKDVLRVVDWQTVEFDAVRAAIAKAEGSRT